MVQEIATACGLAMTAVDGGWFLCAGRAVVVPERTAERHGGRSLHVIPVSPPSLRAEGVAISTAAVRGV